MNFKNDLPKGYRVNDGYYYKYQNSLIDNIYIEDEIGVSFKKIKGYTSYPESYYIELLNDYFLYRAFYSIEILDNKKESLIELSRVNQYTNILIHLNLKCSEAKRKSILLKYFFLNMQNIVPLITISFLSQEKEISKILIEDVINSVNAKNSIIERGLPDALSSWFTLEIFSICFNITINKKIANYPRKDNFIHYQNILDKWNTNDIIEVEQMIYFLIELHGLNVEKENRKYDTTLLYATTFFPFEILAWLKLREKAGLKNPTEFSHPLMNTPIAKMFLELKEPLPKPTELPYAKELLEKLKEKCPDVEVAEWLAFK